MASVRTDNLSPAASTWNRTLPGSISIKPASLPAPSDAAESPNLDAHKVAADVLDALNGALSSANYEAASRLFLDDGYWRDHLALSWDFRTVHSSSAIADFLEACSASRDGFRLKTMKLDTSSAVRSPRVVSLSVDGLLAIRLFFTFDTSIGTGRGAAYLVDDREVWKIYFFHTSLRELKGFEEATGQRRPIGVRHGEQPGRWNWTRRREAEVDNRDGNAPAVLIIGAGHSGLAVAARLKMLGVKSLIIDKNARVGDGWRKRYDQLVLRDPIYFNEMPYLPFPQGWPLFTPKDKMAQWLESYATVLELNIWMKTEIVSTEWDENDGEWMVRVTRKLENDSAEDRMLYPRHIIQATGQQGKKYQPQVEGIESFKGDRICHSSEFSGARPEGQGKRAVVIGSSNSAQDIALDFVEQGYDVTIVQRSSTFVTSSSLHVRSVAMAGYSEDGPPVEDADLLMTALPLAVFKRIQIGLMQLHEPYDKKMLDGLAKAGFRYNRGPDDAGFFFSYFEGGGGMYIDVGSSKLIANGKIRVKSGVQVTRVLPHAIRFSDNTEIRADEIVFATGYQGMESMTRDIFGGEVAHRIGDTWGFDEEGEIRTMWRKSGHPGFWLHGGNMALSRIFSRLLALQIKGLEEELYQYGDI